MKFHKETRLRKNKNTKIDEMEAFKPKWVNPLLDIIGVNLLRLRGLQIMFIRKFTKYTKIIKIKTNNDNQNNLQVPIVI